MRRFEGGSGRFFEIRRDGTTVLARSGKLGTDGKALTPKQCASIEKAEAEIAKRAAEHLRKGFSEVVQPTGPEPRNPGLEQQIIEEPTDSDRYMVYADWLQTQGHPRGELGAIQRGRVARPASAALAKAEQKLLDQHPWLAPVRLMAAARRARKADATDAADAGLTVSWEHGFIVAARIERGADGASVTVRELVAELLAHPAARFLRELRIGALGRDEHDYAGVIEEIVRGCPSTLRVLSLVDLPPGSAELVFASLADVTPLLAATPLLEELRLAGQHVQLRALDLPKLRRFAVATADPGVLLALAQASLPALEALQLSSGDAPMPAPALGEVLAARWPVRQLAITRTANTDELVPWIVKARLLPGLAALDLSGGKLTDTGAGLLAMAKPKLQHLERLDLSGNTLTPSGVRQVAGLCRDVRVDHQRAALAATITEDALRQMAPDAGALAKAREIAKPTLWATLGRDDTTYWGEHRGSRDTYEVYVSVPGMTSGCSCPSGKRPCKHAIALAILVAEGHPFKARALPSGLTDRAGSSRYYNSWE